MAKKKQDDPPKGSPAWMATFSDLMNLLLCFFVLLFSMSSVDANKWEEVVASMTSAFSVFNEGSTAIGDGTLVGMGTTQLSNLDEYYSSMGQTAEESGDDIKHSKERIPIRKTETAILKSSSRKQTEKKRKACWIRFQSLPRFIISADF